MDENRPCISLVIIQPYLAVSHWPMKLFVCFCFGKSLSFLHFLITRAFAVIVFVYIHLTRETGMSFNARLASIPAV